MLVQDYQVVTDKQLMQYQLVPKSRWRTLQNYCRFQSQNAQMFGYVFHDTKWPKSWADIEDPWFLLNETCMVTHWLDDHSEKLYKNLDGRKYRIGNACSFIENKV